MRNCLLVGRLLRAGYFVLTVAGTVFRCPAEAGVQSVSLENRGLGDFRSLRVKL